MKVHVLQHVPFEDIGSMAAWLDARHAQRSYTRFFDNAQLPDPTGFDLVIAMGGPMSVNDEATLPWLVAEKRFIRTVIEHGTPVLGICLGAQLIASALGARVCANTEKEIGWFDIEAVGSSADAFRFPERSRVFHWHGETFELPPGAIHLARSAGCANQAFQIGNNVIGLQFHLETTPDSAQALVTHCGDELIEARYVQSETAILHEPAASYAAIHTLMEQLLDFLARR